MNDKFNYWDDDHYTYKVITGSKPSCLAVYRQECQAYPVLSYGTHINEITSGDGIDYQIIIKRFKTKEVCKKHVAFPPSYVREGKIL